jgi:peptidoglycan/LPS O-acetylase OafA/YrhL
MTPVESKPLRNSGKGGRLAALDGLRFVAAMLVVLGHYVGSSSAQWGQKTTTIFPWLHPFASWGFTGVQLFFLISGFVICMSSWGRGLGNFFVSRITRLYPAFVVGVIATSVVIALLPVAFTQVPWSHVVVNLTMFQSPLGAVAVDPVYWTLWAEMRFYLLFALFVVLPGVTYRRVVMFCVLWTAVSIFANGVDFPLLRDVTAYEHSMYFIAGIAFYLMHRFGPTLLLWGIVGISLLRGQFMMLLANGMDKPMGSPHPWSIGAAIITGYFAVIAAVALGWLSWARWRWLTVAGALTYPLYLLHNKIGLTVIKALSSSVPKWPLLLGVIAAMLLASWLVSRFIEQPLAPLIKRGLRDSLVALRRGSESVDKHQTRMLPSTPVPDRESLVSEGVPR